MTMSTIEEIQDAIGVILGDADGRDLTDEESAQIEAHETELGAAQARRDRTEALKARQAERAKVVTPALVTGAGTPKVDDTLDRAFTAYLRTGRENADIQELRAAQSEGTASEGGFLVPDTFRTKLVDRMKAFGGLANVVEEITTDSGNSIEWPTLDDTANSGEIVDEGGTFSGGADLVFGQASLGAYSYMAGGAGGLPLRISRELVQDSAIDIEGLVSAKLGQRMARIQAQHLVSGTGVKQPQGIVTGRTGIQLAANTAISYADLLGFVHAVDPAYRESGSLRWAMNDASVQYFQGLVDTVGRPLLGDSPRGIDATPGGTTLLGYPVTIDQGFANINRASSSVNWGVFGNLSEGYIVRRVRAVELLVNPYSRMANRQIEYSAWARMDAVQQNTNAYVALSGHNG